MDDEPQLAAAPSSGMFMDPEPQLVMEAIDHTILRPNYDAEPSTNPCRDGGMDFNLFGCRTSTNGTRKANELLGLAVLFVFLIFNKKF